IRQSARAAFDRAERVEGHPGGICPDPGADLLRSDFLANKRKHERLGYAHDREQIVSFASDVEVSAGAGDADAEQVGGYAGESRIDLRVLTVPDGDEARVSFVDELL